jgi:hypothetical protein
MASKGTKRANSSAAAPVAKRTKDPTQASPKKAASKKVAEASPKIESVFACIVTALGKADHVPEQCREMLIAMVEPSLSVPKSERHATQILGVSMIEETLQDIKLKQVLAVEQAQEQMSKVEGCKASQAGSVCEAQADFTSKEAEEALNRSACETAKNLMKDAEATLADAEEIERKGKEPLANLEMEKATLEKISEEHVKVPLEANEGPHFHALEPHIQALGLDESLAIALPSSCAKTREQRGGFDDVVLTELEKALAKKIASLANAISEEMPRVAEREAAVIAAKSSLEAKVAAAKAAGLELEGAEGARSESFASLSKAKDKLEALEPSLQEATNTLQELKTVLNNFETGPLATFQLYQNKAAVTEEAAPAGA